MTQQITLATIQKKLAELQEDIATLIGNKISISVEGQCITSYTQLRVGDEILVAHGSTILAGGKYTVTVVEPVDYDGGLTIYLRGEGWVSFDDLLQETTVTRLPY